MIRHEFSGRMNADEFRHANPNGLTNEEIQRLAPSAFAGQAHESRSDRYAFLPTVNIIDAMRQNGFVPIKASQSIVRSSDNIPFAKHMIRFRQQGVLNQVGDSVVETILTNAHNGTSSYRLLLGLFRLACLNGLVVSEGLVGSVHIRHVGNISDLVIENSLALIAQASKIADVVGQWRQIELSEPQMLALAIRAKALRFGEDGSMVQAISADRLLAPRRIDDKANDLWTVLNRIQENTLKGGVCGFIPQHVNAEDQVVPARRVRSREVKGIDQNIKLNQGLWEEAEKIAAMMAKS